MVVPASNSGAPVSAGGGSTGGVEVPVSIDGVVVAVSVGGVVVPAVLGVVVDSPLGSPTSKWVIGCAVPATPPLGLSPDTDFTAPAESERQ